MMTRLLAAVAAASLAGSGTSSQGLPPLAPELDGVAAVVCLRIDDLGAVSGAFVVGTTGEAARDRALLAWVRQLRWDPVRPGEAPRNRWFPMPIAIGGATPPPPPPSCAPPADSQAA